MKDLPVYCRMINRLDKSDLAHNQLCEQNDMKDGDHNEVVSPNLPELQVNVQIKVE